MHATVRCALCLVAALALGGCGDDAGDPSGDAGGTCLEPLPDDCEPAFAPTFEAIYRNELSQKCGGSVCHGVDGRQNGLVLAGEQVAYDHLLGEGGAPRVIPGDPECSELMRRLRSTDPDIQMPPNAPLSARSLCAIDRWIRNGAMQEEE